MTGNLIWKKKKTKKKKKKKEKQEMSRKRNYITNACMSELVPNLPEPCYYIIRQSSQREYKNKSNASKRTYKKFYFLYQLRILFIQFCVTAYVIYFFLTVILDKATHQQMRLLLGINEKYHINPKYWDILTPYHTCTKTWTRPFNHLFNVSKNDRVNDCITWSDAALCGV